MSIEAMKQALEALDEFMTDYQSEDGMNSMKHYAKKHYAAITSLRQAIVEAEKQEPVAWLTDDEREAFERFNETCEDGEGYDVPKTMMRRLAEIGVIHHTSRGIYGITKFGRSLVGYTTPPQRQPLMQPIIKDEHGVIRFKKNGLVNTLYEHGVMTGLGLNELHCMDFTDEDRQQFAQLIGYSVDGYGTLSYVTDDAYEAAQQATHGIKGEA